MPARVAPQAQKSGPAVAGVVATGAAGGAVGVGAGGDSAAVPDEALLRRLRGGEAAAGEALAKRYFEPLMRYLQRLAGPQVAEELHQQTWLSVLDHLDRFDPASAGGGFKAWLFRIATNKANDHWRSRGREQAANEGLKLLAEGEDQLPAAEFRLEAAEQEVRLKRAIEQLPESQRQVLMLRYYGNLKFVEIAKMLGCPLNTALGRVHKALIRLRQLMKD